MSNKTTKTAPLPRRRKPADWRTIGFGGAAVFLAVFTLLAARMQNGLDPVLGSTSKQQTASVLQRNLVIKRKIINETIEPADPATQASASAGNAQSGKPATTYSAPANTNYIPAPAPVTRAS